MPAFYAFEENEIQLRLWWKKQRVIERKVTQLIAESTRLPLSNAQIDAERPYRRLRRDWKGT